MKKSIVFAAIMLAAVSANATTSTKKAKAPKPTTYTVAETKRNIS